MRLTARLFPLGRSGDALATALDVAALDVTSARIAVPLDDLGRALEAGDAADGFWVAGEASFAPAELASISHFELVCRGVVAETARDSEANLALCKATPPFDAGGWAPIRRVRGLTLTRIPLAPNRVGAVGQWTAEYVAGAAVLQSLSAAAVTGLELVPVTSTKSGAPHPAHRQLFSAAILAPAVVDGSVERISSRFAEEDGALRHLGCLAYEPEALAATADFNRTAEPWAGWNGWPSWVVSRRVVDVFRRAKLRGWHFRPVLVTGTPLYAESVERWRELRNLVARSRRSQLDGGRW